MNGRIDWSELFFSSSGRVSRMPFLIASAVLIVLTAFFESAVPSGLHLVVGVVFYPVILFCAACVLSKRLHDRGKSGWWAALILVAVMMVWPRPEGVLDFLGLIALAWAIVELALMPGEQGANRYGPNPQRAAHLA